MQGNLLEVLKKRISAMDKKQAFLVIVLFLFAYGIRAHLAKYELFFEFDSYYHARIDSYVIQTGSAPEIDKMSWYSGPEGGAPLPASGKFFWYFNALMYKIFTLGGPYNKDTWIMLVKILPALYGALISISMFFFGKELYGRRAGYTMAFFAAVIPAFVYRTMAGFFEEDCLGFLWMVIGLVFFARAIKEPEFTRKKLGYAVLSGIFFAIMAFTWQMFLLVPLVLLGYVIFGIINFWADNGLKAVKPFAGIFAISIATFTAMTFFYDGGAWIEHSLNYITGSIPGSMSWLAFGGGAAMLALIVYLLFSAEKSKEGKESTIKMVKLIAMLLLFGTLILFVIIIMTAPNLWRPTGVLGTSVGEESPGRNYFGEKYNAMIVIPVLAFLLIPLRIYRNKNDHLSALVFFWIFITLFMAWYKLKFTYTLGLPLAAGAGVITAELFSFLGGRTDLEKKAIIFVWGFMFLVGAAAGAMFVEDKMPNIEQPIPDWKSALYWIRDETPKDAKFFNWWDYGHWISFIGERAVLTDNRNLYMEQLQDVAKLMLTSDLNEAVDIVKRNGSDYVIFSMDNFDKMVSYGEYAFNTTNIDDPRIVPFRYGPNATIVCNPVTENNEQKYVCGGNVLNEAQASALRTDWTTQPRQLYENRVPLFIYVDSETYALYVLNPAGNESTLAKLWFHNPDAMAYFEEVYAKRGIRIFRLKKEMLGNID